jgi:hypothetical protein
LKGVPDAAPPEVLDPDRLRRDDRTTVTQDERGGSELLLAALQDSCGYAQQLWHRLDEIRHYLMTSLPPDPRAPGTRSTTAASPSGPDDEEGWTNWIIAYGAVNSVLCGPQGDSGFGLGEARHAAELRRSAPVLTVPTQPVSTEQGKDGGPSRNPPWGSRRSRFVRGTAVAALVILALRGLGPRRARADSGRADR